MSFRSRIFNYWRTVLFIDREMLPFPLLYYSHTVTSYRKWEGAEKFYRSHEKIIMQTQCWSFIPFSCCCCHCFLSTFLALSLVSSEKLILWSHIIPMYPHFLLFHLDALLFLLFSFKILKSFLLVVFFFFSFLYNL